MSLLLLAGLAQEAAAGAEASTASNGLPPSVDLRPSLEAWGLGPRQQGARGTCSVFVVAGALEFALAKREGQVSRLSVEFLNWAANEAGHDKQDGGFFSDLWNGFIAHGICAEGDMPYQTRFDPADRPGAAAMVEAKRRVGLGLQLHWIKEWNVRTGLSDEHLLAIRSTLQRGWPVCAGLRWPKREQWVDGVLQMCPPEAVRDGHSVLLVGYREDAKQPGGGVFLFRNTAGSGADGWMSYEYAQAYMNDAAWVE